MKKAIINKSGNKHDAALVKAEQEVLQIYDHIEKEGKTPSSRKINKQISILRRQTNSGTGIKYLFTCC